MAPIDEEIQMLYVAHEQLSGKAAPLITSKSKIQGLCMCFKGLEHSGRSVIGGCCTSTLNERSILSSLIEKKIFLWNCTYNKLRQSLCAVCLLRIEKALKSFLWWTRLLLYEWRWLPNKKKNKSTSRAKCVTLEGIYWTWKTNKCVLFDYVTKNKSPLCFIC